MLLPSLQLCLVFQIFDPVCYNKILDTGWFKLQKWILSQFQRLEVWGCQHGQFLVRAFILACKLSPSAKRESILIFLLIKRLILYFSGDLVDKTPPPKQGVQVWSLVREIKSHIPGGMATFFFFKDTNPITKPNPNYPTKASSPYIITLGVRLQHMYFRRKHSV